MGRILAIDYGLKRCGIAVTDMMQIVASPYDTIPSEKLLKFLKEYVQKESVEAIVVGRPVRINLEDSHITADTDQLVIKLKGIFPELKIETVDERFTSKMATQTIANSGLTKKKRKEKGLIDKVSASLILQTYLGI